MTEQYKMTETKKRRIKSQINIYKQKHEAVT